MNHRTIHKLLAAGAIAVAGVAAATSAAATATGSSASSLDIRSPQVAGVPTAAAIASTPLTATATVSAASSSLVLPSPSGRSAVGTYSVRWVDRSRPDPFVQNKRRDLMVQFWYPSARTAGSVQPPYLSTQTARAFEQTVGIGTPVLDSIGVHARLGARAANGRYPVVLFTPGFQTARGIYTSLLEDLASHGFVVIAIDHPYDAGAVEFPDGRLELQRLMEGQEDRALKIRIADLRFVLNRLPGVNARGQLARKLDLQHIGMFGHSNGGAATAEVMLRDRRVDAGANLDGSFLQRAARRGVRGPFMLMTEPGGVGPSEQAYRTGLRRSQLRLTLRDSEHYTFSDFAFTLPTLEQLAPGLRDILAVGSIDGRRALAIERRYLRAFFSAHLKGTQEPLLSRASTAYPEVGFVRGTH